MARPRILLLSKLFWPEGSGAELATYLIVRDILSRYFHVTVVSGTRSPKLDLLRLTRYVYWSVLEAKYKPIEWIKLTTGINWLKKLVEGADIIYISSHTLIPLTVVAKMIKPSIRVVLHLHNFQVLTYTSIVLADREPDMATDIIVEFEEHGSLLRALLAGIGYHVNYVNRFALKYADKVILVSKRQHDILVRYLPWLDGRTTILYNPLPQLQSVEKRLNAEPTILYSGGESYIKGFHVALKALIEVLKKCDCKAYIISRRKSTYMEKTRSIAEKLDSKLIVLSWLPHEEYLSLHKQVWGILVPSICEEPMPYAIAESMLMGTVPIASKAGGIPELISDTPAEEFLFTPGDVSELISKIEKLISISREEVTNIGAQLREKAHQLFDQERIEREIVNLFESLAQ